MHERAGSVALDSDLVDVDALLAAYFSGVPDAGNPEQRVVFGTSGHRGSSLKLSFNETHIAAITQAIVDYRREAHIGGPVFVGHDTHALSEPALNTVLAVLRANAVATKVSAAGDFVPTPAVSRAILAHNEAAPSNLADGIVITPSHNPPGDGGIKYNPTHGGPADTDATSWIASRANNLIASGEALAVVNEQTHVDAAPANEFDFAGNYVDALDRVINLNAIRDAGVRLGAHPLGGASVSYWPLIAKTYGLDITVLGPGVDPTWRFMSLDWDGQIRMDPSSEHAMAALVAQRAEYDLLVANDADADRHGIVTPDAGLMNPNHFLAVAIEYLLTHRPGWAAGARVGKTAVSSVMIDRVVAAANAELFEVPVGFKWFVPGMIDQTLVFGGEESAGASFLQNDLSPWSTDKDGILMCLLAAEILAVTGQSPSERYRRLVERFGETWYERIDTPASQQQKQAITAIDAATLGVTQLAGDDIIDVTTVAPGNHAPLGGIKVRTAKGWFAVRPSGTEDVAKLYAESLVSAEHLHLIQTEAQSIVQLREGASS